MENENLYTSQQVEEIARRAAQYAVEQVLSSLNLENDIGLSLEGDNDMSKYVREKVSINGRDVWIGGYTKQQLHESYIHALEREGLISRVEHVDAVPLFGDYIDKYYKTYRTDQEENTTVNRERIIRNHIRPAFGSKRIDRITTTDLQEYFNQLGKNYSKETALKIRNTMNPVFNAAVEDELIKRNPLNSDRLEITGKDTVSHKAIPKEKMEMIKEAIPSLEERVRFMASLLCYTGMRFEEVLGLKWEDLDGDWICIQRAIVHPTRNQPVVKDPKTETSKRIIPYIKPLKSLMEPYRSSGYILSKNYDGEAPLSYTEARRTFEKIRKQFGLDGYSAHDFRDTCATEWREAGIPLDVIARLLGHAKTETTEKKYVKYRKDLLLQSVDTLNTL